MNRQELKDIILLELEKTEPLFPSDISEKYGLDYDLVDSCFEELEKEGLAESRDQEVADGAIG